MPSILEIFAAVAALVGLTPHRRTVAVVLTIDVGLAELLLHLLGL